MMRLKWEILIGILAMLVGIVFIGWYMSEFQGSYTQNIPVYTGSQSASKGMVLANEVPQSGVASIDVEPAAGTRDIDSSDISSIASEGEAAEVTTQNGDQTTTPPVEVSSTNANMAAKTRTRLQNGTAVNHAVNDADSGAHDPSRLRSDDPGLDAWSEDRFVGKINTDQADSDLSSSMSIRDEIASALKGHNKPVDHEDTYFTAIAKESSVLTVTTASEDKGLNFTRNIQPSTPARNPGQPTQTGKDEEASLAQGFIVIKPGESLTAIAYRLYKDPNAYAKILELNKDVIGDPDRILAGQKIRLPAP